MPNEDNNFYKTPSKKEEEEPAFIQLPVVQAKNITRNNTITAFVFLAAILGFAFWVATSFENFKKPEPIETPYETEEMEGDPESFELTGDDEVSAVETNTVTEDYKYVKLADPNIEILVRPEANKNVGISLTHINGSFLLERNFNVVFVKDDNGEAEGEKEDKDTHNLDLYIGLAEQYLSVNNLTDAKKALKEVVKAEPEHQRALELYVAVYSNEAEYPKAIHAAESLIKLKPIRPDYLNNLGVLYLKNKESAKAEVALKKAVGLNPDFLDAHINLALLFISQDKNIEAESLLKPMQVLYPRNESVLLSLGIAYQQQEKYLLANKRLEELTKLAPENPAAYFQLAKTAILQKNKNQALIWLKLGNKNAGAEEFRPYLADEIFNPLRHIPQYEVFLGL